MYFSLEINDLLVEIIVNFLVDALIGQFFIFVEGTHKLCLF